MLGAGLAGLCAALTAAEAGASVLLVEKQDEPGGSTVLSVGFFAFAGTPLQATQSVADTPELLFQDLRTVGGETTDIALLRAYVDGQAELHDWLVARNIQFTALELSAGQSVARSHQTNMPAMIATLAA
ncbi:MAG: FAD-dependent oxidoreductase, partial [Janthinobacterium lividum]